VFIYIFLVCLPIVALIYFIAKNSEEREKRIRFQSEVNTTFNILVKRLESNQNKFLKKTEQELIAYVLDCLDEMGASEDVKNEILSDFLGKK